MTTILLFFWQHQKQQDWSFTKRTFIGECTSWHPLTNRKGPLTPEHHGGGIRKGLFTWTSPKGLFTWRSQKGSIYMEVSDGVCLHGGARKGLFTWRSQKGFIYIESERAYLRRKTMGKASGRSIDTDIPRRKSHKGFIYKEIPKEWFQNRSFTQKY